VIVISAPLHSLVLWCKSSFLTAYRLLMRMPLVQTLFTVDVQRGTLSEASGVNVNKSISALAPLLTLHERIVRFKHPIVHAALHDFAEKSKIPISLNDSETDLLLRVLTYAKLTLPKSNEPTLDNSAPSVGDRLYHQHYLLEYAVRYWVLHLQRSPLAPKLSREFKPSAELQKALPDTVMLPVLEQLV
jgi:hypothetical protein